MLVAKSVNCIKCHKKFERASRVHKVCYNCIEKSRLETNKKHTIIMRERAKKQKPSNYTVVNKEGFFLGFLIAYNKTDAKSKLEKGEYLYGKPFGCTYY